MSIIGVEAVKAAMKPRRDDGDDTPKPGSLHVSAASRNEAPP